LLKPREYRSAMSRLRCRCHVAQPVRDRSFGNTKLIGGLALRQMPPLDCFSEAINEWMSKGGT